MKLHQLKYLVAVADHDLNITAAALSLHTVQPGVSKQIMLLEEELGFNIFVRRGRSLVHITPAGERVIERARHAMRDVQEIKSLGADLRQHETGSLSLATTHTQARYVLPRILRQFRDATPEVQVHLHQGDTGQLRSLVSRERVDLVIATGAEEEFSDLVRLPCYRWRPVIVVPRAHPLSGATRPTLAQLAAFPIITYSFSFNGSTSLLDHFREAGVEPHIALTALDADVIKTYLRKDLGVAIISELALDPIADSDLVTLDASHLFPEHMTWVGFRRGALLRRYVYDFIALLAPHLGRRDVRDVEQLASQSEIDVAFLGRHIPYRGVSGALIGD